MASPLKDAYSETFIRAHIERLPVKTLPVYGRFFPERLEDDRAILSFPLVFTSKILRTFLKPFHLISPGCADRESKRLQALGVARFLRRNGVKAVLAEFAQTGVAVMEICRRTAIPLIVHFHGYDASDYQILSRYEQSYRQLFNLASAIIAVSKDMKAGLLALGAPRAKLHYNPYGVDCSFFKKAEPGQQPPHFLAVGRFVDKKAPHLTVLAFEKVIQSCPEARLTMIGDGNLLDACKQLSKALKMDHKITFAGSHPHIEVSAAMQRARAFVQHSVKATYGDSEGTPVAVLEAGASGLPVVATRHGGIKDAVINGETGFLVDKCDVDGMAAHMLRLAQEPELAAAMGHRAREHVKANFSMERSISRLWNIISDVIERSGGKN